jgi:1-deoxy-D-xylulose-5-phosphate synthase
MYAQAGLDAPAIVRTVTDLLPEQPRAAKRPARDTNVVSVSRRPR